MVAPRTALRTDVRLKKAMIWVVVATTAAVALVLLAVRPAAAAVSTVQDRDRTNTQYGDWMFTMDPGASGGWESTSRTHGASATLRFKGTSVAWKTIKYDGGGVTDVFLDGKKVASFDAFSLTQQNNVTGYSARGLNEGKHTLKLVVDGEKRPGYFVILDRFVVDGSTIEEDSARITYDGWSASANARASGGSYRQSTSETKGARCGMFSGGSEITLITAKGPTRGLATVRVKDISTGTFVKTEQVNLHSATNVWQHPVRMSGLETNKTYILEVVSDDGKPVVFDGCTGNLAGPIN